MTWMKIDDRLHSHRKTRAVTKSHPDKARDAAPMGLWVVAGSWASQNGTDGWVPEDELDRWDDDWKMLAERLVDAGYWWVEDHGGEAGYGFHDWHDYNLPTDSAAKSGEYGNHVRWHEKRGRVDPECEHCPKEPDPSDSLPDIAPRSAPDRRPDRSTPTQPDPSPARSQPVGARRARQLPSDWQPNEGHRTFAAENRLNLDAEAEQFADHHRAKGSTMKDWDAAFRTWLRNAVKWRKDAPAVAPTRSLPHASELELPPDGLTPDEYAAWEAEQRRKRAAR